MLKLNENKLASLRRFDDVLNEKYGSENSAERKEFDDFYDNLDERTQEKYDYAFNMIRTQYIVNKKLL